MTMKGTADDVLATLRGLLGDDSFAPGKRLPTERALAAELGVNRATLRKALARLEAEGAIIRHVGRGTFVAAPPQAPETITGKASPIELMDARLALEPVVAREAALRARKEDLKRLHFCLARSEAADDYSGFEEWDVAFHRALADATQNPIFGMVMEVMRQMRSSPEWDRLKRASFNPRLRDVYRAEHRAILQALDARDQASAAAAMFRHMQTVRDAVTGGTWTHDIANAAHPALVASSREEGTWE